MYRSHSSFKLSHWTNDILPETEWSAAKETRSARDGTKASSQLMADGLWAHFKEFAVWVCNKASWGAYNVELANFQLEIK